MIRSVTARGLLPVFSVLHIGVDPVQASEGQARILADAFAMAGDACLMNEDHLGILNGKMTVGINHKGVASIGGFWSPPYVSSDFLLELRVHGEKPLMQHYTWLPMEVRRSGRIQEIDLTSVTALIPGRRAGLRVVDIQNNSSAP